MAIRLKPITPKDNDVRQLQQNVADAVEALDSKGQPPLGVLAVSASRTLVGNEDVVLVDASTATVPLTLVLPAARVMQRRLTIHVTKAGQQAVTVKPVEISSTASPTINGGDQVSIASGQAGSLTIVSDGRNFWTI